MTVERTPVFVLPNVPLDQAVECGIAAIAPAHDPCVGTLMYWRGDTRLPKSYLSQMYLRRSVWKITTALLWDGRS